jgi:hypothetical protein
MSKEVPIDIYPETNACVDMGDIRVISTPDALCGSHAVQQNFQLLCAQK